MTAGKEKDTAAPRFALSSRILHWVMAPMVIVQLLVGVTMVASLSCYPWLLAIHKPLGVLILMFALIRLVNRRTHTLPPFLASMSPAERKIASWSERLLYTLLIVQPLVGWAMLSAARWPIVSLGPFELPGIAPHNIDAYAFFRVCHDIFAVLLFAAFTAHVCAILFHTLVLRDGLLYRMAVWRTKPPQQDPTTGRAKV